jgi:DNA-binding beta-propeller fold protein YncE
LSSKKCSKIILKSGNLFLRQKMPICSNKLMVVVDALTGKVITTLPIGEGCDGAAFDPMYKRAYASNGEGTLTVVQEGNNNSFKVLESVLTQPGARTITLDKTSHHIYLTTAEYESAPSEGNRRIFL